MKTNNEETSNATANAAETPATESNTITNGQRDTIMQCLRTLHGIVQTGGGNWSPLPAFDECSDDQRDFILGRTQKVLARKGEAERAETKNAVKAAVETIIAQHRATLEEGRKAVADLLKAQPALASTVKAPESVDIAVFALLAAFPGSPREGTSEGATAILVLRDLGYEVRYGAGKGKEKLSNGYVRLTHEAPKAETKVA